MRLAITSLLLCYLTESTSTAFVVVAPRHVHPLHGTLHRQRRSQAVHAVTAPTIQIDALKNLLQGFQPSRRPENAVELFFQSWNNRDFNSLANQFADDCTFEDTSFPKPFQGKSEINRHFRLLADATTSKFVLDDIAVDNDNNKIAVLYHVEQDNAIVPNSRHCAFYTLDRQTGLITSVVDTVEPASKTGATDLAILSFISKLFSGDKETEHYADDNADKIESSVTNKSVAFFNREIFRSTPTTSSNAAERYFAAWNRRDMDAAIAVFADDCQYEDTVFPDPFDGKAALQKHLYLCADSMPPTFSFVIDDVADGKHKLGVKWHVENAGKPLPFTRGCSFYTIDKSTGLVQTGIDEVEPAVFKLGGLKLFTEALQQKLTNEPLRLLPLGIWVAYVYTVFFSDGILPGANALQLEQRTWEEVKDLSLNFFLVSPLLGLPFSPTVHPILEGVFNILLSWAALFAGFLSDERSNKPNIFPILPAVAGMQFLTSAFLLPYLTLRSSETAGERVYIEDLDTPAKIVENRWLGPFLGTVGAGALTWGAIARASDFGGLEERMSSFWQLISIDRVGSSFLVDLAIFAAFQGWLVDDDLRRRGVADDELSVLRNTAKYVPFFGLAAYMFLRPTLSNRGEDGAI